MLTDATAIITANCKVIELQRLHMCNMNIRPYIEACTQFTYMYVCIVCYDC